MNEEKLPGGLFRVGNKLFGICADCRSVVRFDKPLIGSWHFCSGEYEENRGKSKDGTMEQGTVETEREI